MAKKEADKSLEIEKGIEKLVKQIEGSPKESKNKKPLKPLIKVEEKKEATKSIPKSVEELKGISVKKNENFSQWYTEVVEKCELADIRYNVKGFLVFQPWSVLSMEKMYGYMERALQKKNHKPYWFPTLIPEKNLTRETQHVKGFTPQVFWITEAGNDKLEERLALRPTSETAMYPMFSIWIRSYKDLPFKIYQRANVFRYETKMTRPFLRSREFYWIEAHCAHASKEDGMKQVQEDMQTTQEVLHDIYGLPFMFFERPVWDKFPGAYRTFAADVLNPDGKVIQQPSTHLLTPEFAKGFDVKFKDKEGKDQVCWITCYGPAISRIFASVVIVHGDDKGLRIPFKIAPVQIMIVPIKNDDKILKKAGELMKNIEDTASVQIDPSEKSAGEKFNYWEMKGVPFRIDLGLKDIESGKLTIFRRDLNKKEVIDEKDFVEYIKKTSVEFDKNLIKEADKLFESRIKDAKSKKEIQKVVDGGAIARANFCSVDKEGIPCAGIIEKEIGATVRGTKLEREIPAKGEKCAICDKPAKEIVYVAREY